MGAVKKLLEEQGYFEDEQEREVTLSKLESDAPFGRCQWCKKVLWKDEVNMCFRCEDHWWEAQQEAAAEAKERGEIDEEDFCLP